MKKTIALAAASLLALACNPIQGQLKVTKAFSAVERGFFGNETKVTVKAGTYAAKVEFESQTKIALKLDVGQLASQKLILNVPNGRYGEGYEGPISLKASESGQPFDVKGTISNSESDSGSQDAVESCSRQERQRVCETDGPGKNHDQLQGGTVCRDEMVSVPGEQSVRYHYHYSSTSLSLRLVAKDGSTLGTFSGQRNGSDKVYEYTGTCW